MRGFVGSEVATVTDTVLSFNTSYIACVVNAYPDGGETEVPGTIARPANTRTDMFGDDCAKTRNSVPVPVTEGPKMPPVKKAADPACRKMAAG